MRSCVEAVRFSRTAFNPASGCLAAGMAMPAVCRWRICHAVVALALLLPPLASRSVADDGSGGNRVPESESHASQSNIGAFPDAASALLDIPEIEDVRPPIRTLPRNNYLLFLLAAAIALTVAAAGMRYWSRYCKRYARSLALRELERLAGAACQSDSDLFLFYKRLNLALRRYIHRRWKMERMRGSLSLWQRLLLIHSVRAGLRLALTNRELLASLSLDADQEELLRDVLEECDLVKFARLRPGPDAASRALMRARTFVLNWGAEEGGGGCG